jgi:predicted transcriptional regulator
MALVIDNGIIKRSITDEALMSLDIVDGGRSDSRCLKIRDVMDKRFPVVDPDTKIETLRYLRSPSILQ